MADSRGELAKFMKGFEPSTNGKIFFGLLQSGFPPSKGLPAIASLLGSRKRYLPYLGKPTGGKKYGDLDLSDIFSSIAAAGIPNSEDEDEEFPFNMYLNGTGKDPEDMFKKPMYQLRAEMSNPDSDAYAELLELMGKNEGASRLLSDMRNEEIGVDKQTKELDNKILLAQMLKNIERMPAATRAHLNNIGFNIKPAEIRYGNYGKYKTRDKVSPGAAAYYNPCANTIYAGNAATNINGITSKDASSLLHELQHLLYQLRYEYDPNETIKHFVQTCNKAYPGPFDPLDKVMDANSDKYDNAANRLDIPLEFSDKASIARPMDIAAAMSGVWSKQHGGRGYDPQNIDLYGYDFNKLADGSEMNSMTSEAYTSDDRLKLSKEVIPEQLKFVDENMKTIDDITEDYKKSAKSELSKIMKGANLIYVDPKYESMLRRNPGLRDPINKIEFMLKNKDLRNHIFDSESDYKSSGAEHLPNPLRISDSGKVVFDKNTSKNKEYRDAREKILDAEATLDPRTRAILRMAGITDPKEVFDPPDFGYTPENQRLDEINRLFNIGIHPVDPSAKIAMELFPRELNPDDVKVFGARHFNAFNRLPKDYGNKFLSLLKLMNPRVQMFVPPPSDFIGHYIPSSNKIQYISPARIHTDTLPIHENTHAVQFMPEFDTDNKVKLLNALLDTNTETLRNRPVDKKDLWQMPIGLMPKNSYGIRNKVIDMLNAARFSRRLLEGYNDNNDDDWAKNINANGDYSHTPEYYGFNGGDSGIGKYENALLESGANAAELMASKPKLRGLAKPVGKIISAQKDIIGDMYDRVYDTEGKRNEGFYRPQTVDKDETEKMYRLAYRKSAKEDLSKILKSGGPDIKKAYILDEDFHNELNHALGKELSFDEAVKYALEHEDLKPHVYTSARDEAFSGREHLGPYDITEDGKLEMSERQPPGFEYKETYNNVIDKIIAKDPKTAAILRMAGIYNPQTLYLPDKTIESNKHIPGFGVAKDIVNLKNSIKTPPGDDSAFSAMTRFPKQISPDDIRVFGLNHYRAFNRLPEKYRNRLLSILGVTNPTVENFAITNNSAAGRYIHHQNKIQYASPLKLQWRETLPLHENTHATQFSDKIPQSVHNENRKELLNALFDINSNILGDKPVDTEILIPESKYWPLTSSEYNIIDILNAARFASRMANGHVDNTPQAWAKNINLKGINPHSPEYYGYFAGTPSQYMPVTTESGAIATELMGEEDDDSELKSKIPQIFDAQKKVVDNTYDSLSDLNKIKTFKPRKVDAEETNKMLQQVYRKSAKSELSETLKSQKI